MGITLTVFFDGQFWVGLFERRAEDRLSVAKVVFGPEPKEQQVEALVLERMDALRFSPAVDGVKAQTVAANPKRRQRQAARVQGRGVGTKAQQAMQLAHEEQKQERVQRKKVLREEAARLQFQLRQEKKKAKRRGH